MIRQDPDAKVRLTAGSLLGAGHGRLLSDGGGSNATASTPVSPVAWDGQLSWIRLDDHFAEHPKIKEIGPLGLVLQVRALCYCSRYLTDGFLPDTVLKSLLTEFADWNGVVGGNDWPAKMVKAGLWKSAQKKGISGWIIHDYLDYNPSKSLIGKRRKAAQLAGRTGGLARSKSQANRLAGRLSAATPPASQVFKPPAPTPSTRSKDQLPWPSAKVTDDQRQAFESFWQSYPRKVKKLDAQKAWLQTAAVRPEATVLLQALEDHKRSEPWVRDDGRFIPYAASWLRGHRWQDVLDNQRDIPEFERRFLAWKPSDGPMKS